MSFKTRGDGKKYSGNLELDCINLCNAILALPDGNNLQQLIKAEIGELRTAVGHTSDMRGDFGIVANDKLEDIARKNRDVNGAVMRLQYASQELGFDKPGILGERPVVITAPGGKSFIADAVKPGQVKASTPTLPG